jgi:hypothetical protein
MSLTWPKVPKLSDAIEAINALDARLAAIEPYPQRNEARITALEHQAAGTEHGLEEHQAGAAERQREIDALKAQFERERWHAKFRRPR